MPLAGDFSHLRQQLLRGKRPAGGVHTIMGKNQSGETGRAQAVPRSILDPNRTHEERKSPGEMILCQGATCGVRQEDRRWLPETGVPAFRLSNNRRTIALKIPSCALHQLSRNTHPSAVTTLAKHRYRESRTRFQCLVNSIPPRKELDPGGWTGIVT